MTGLRLSYPVDALVSYHYYRDDDTMAALVATGRLRLIGDSGAFSAWSSGTPIRLDEYAAWCRRWWDRLCWAASLDVIGDPTATWRNWAALRDRHDLLTVPTVHAGTDRSWLDAYAAEGVDLIGLGGMAGKGQAPRAFRWAVHMIRHARDRWPQVRFHLWGVTSIRFLSALPVWSADSSGALGRGYRYGSLPLFDPATGRMRTAMLQGRSVYRQAPLIRSYGVDPTHIETSHPGNRSLLIQLAAASTQRYATWLQQRHRVTPPTMLRANTTHGPRGHVVDANPAHLAAMVGPRVHMVSAAAGGRIDDLTTAVTGHTDRLTGPRVHVVDSPDGLHNVIATPEAG